jgi:hypothetical protein
MLHQRSSVRRLDDDALCTEPIHVQLVRADEHYDAVSLSDRHSASADCVGLPEPQALDHRRRAASGASFGRQLRTEPVVGSQ